MQAQVAARRVAAPSNSRYHYLAQALSALLAVALVLYVLWRVYTALHKTVGGVSAAVYGGYGAARTAVSVAYLKSAPLVAHALRSAHPYFTAAVRAADPTWQAAKLKAAPLCAAVWLAAEQGGGRVLRDVRRWGVSNSRVWGVAWLRARESRKEDEGRQDGALCDAAMTCNHDHGMGTSRAPQQISASVGEMTTAIEEGRVVGVGAAAAGGLTSREATAPTAGTNTHANTDANKQNWAGSEEEDGDLNRVSHHGRATGGEHGGAADVQVLPPRHVAEASGPDAVAATQSVDGGSVEATAVAASLPSRESEHERGQVGGGGQHSAKHDTGGPKVDKAPPGASFGVGETVVQTVADFVSELRKQFK